MADDRAHEVERLRAENSRLRDRYERLRRRKSVRVALWLAGLPNRIRKADRTPPQSSVEEPASGPTPDPATPVFDLALLETAPPVSVVIPVYNAPQALTRCLESVTANTSTATEIVVIDDASTDPEVRRVLDRFEGVPNARVLRNEVNLGFTATVNRGMDLAVGDVILLNADTQVPPRWVEGLRRAAYSDGDIASSTAISNNAGAFSAPAAGGGPAPGDRTVADLGRAAARTGVRVLPSPTANGFCCYLKRAAIDDVGVFDAAAFPRGYGEENDWSLRATGLGWRHIVASDVYVLHERSASFGSERSDLARAGADVLASHHPDYQREFDRFVGSPQLEALRLGVGEALGRSSVRPRVLSIVHALGGGTELSTRDLAGGVRRYEVLVLKCSPHRWVLSHGDGTQVQVIDFDVEVTIADFVSHHQRHVLAQILVDHDIEIVHLRHSMHQAIGNVEVAKLLGIPVVVSLHDYYLICPTAHLIDERGRYCAGVCTPGQGVCPADAWVTAGPHLKHAWVGHWQRRTRTLLGSVDVISAASQSTLDLHDRVLAPAAEVERQVIPHGRDLDRGADLAEQPPADGPMRVLMAGTIGRHKGNEVVRNVLQRVRPGSLEFHILGTFPGEPCDGVVVHGRYARDSLPSLVGRIRPSIAAILSVTPETWSHTLTEFWSLGIPVVVSDQGAPAQRVSEQGGGWIVPAGDVERTADLLTTIRAGRAGFELRVAEARRAQWSSVEEMAAAYERMFDGVLVSSRTART